MSSDWRTVRLSEVASEVTVGFVGTMANEYVDSGIPFLRSLNVDRFKIDTAEIKYISPHFHSSIPKSCLRPGDVVIVRTGKPGTCAVIPDELPESNCSDLVIVRCGSEILNRFLCYYVNSAASNHIAAHLVGAVQQHFNVASAKTMEIPLPSIREQKAIAHILGTLDDKIELNRKTNETLEAMAKALFKSWFVDFDPVKAKAEGRPTGLPAEISDLFPDSFEDSELGEIPSGWSIYTLREVLTPIKERQQNRTLEEFSATVSGIQPRGDRFKKDLSRSREKNKVALEGDLVFGLSRRIINFGRMPKTIGAFSPVYEVFRATSNSAISTKMIEQFIRLRMNEFMVILKPAAREGQAIDRDVLLDQFILNSPVKICDQCDSLVEPLAERMRLLNERTFVLEQLRDTLLPKLISGEIRIPDAEKMLEEVIV